MATSIPTIPIGLVWFNSYYSYMNTGLFHRFIALKW